MRRKLMVALGLFAFVALIQYGKSRPVDWPTTPDGRWTYTSDPSVATSLAGKITPINPGHAQLCSQISPTSMADTKCSNVSVVETSHGLTVIADSK